MSLMSSATGTTTKSFCTRQSTYANSSAMIQKVGETISNIAEKFDSHQEDHFRPENMGFGDYFYRFVDNWRKYTFSFD